MSVSTATPSLTLRNPMRYLVPLGTAALAIVMFIVPLGFAGVSGAKVIAGVAILGLCIAWMIHSAWFAPFECVIENDLAIRRGAGTRHYSFDQIRKWWFAVPDGAPTQAPPATNGVLYLVMSDRTRFRAEVTSEEARSIASRFTTTQG